MRALPFAIRCFLAVAGLTMFASTAWAGKAKPAPPPVEGAAYEGTLGKTRIQARLNLNAPVPGGWYWSDIESPGEDDPRTGYGEALKLAVEKTGDTGLTMTEHDAEGKAAGTFTGALDENGVLSGFWVREAGGRKLPFTLRPLDNALPHFSLALAVAEEETNRRSLYDVKVEIPRMTCPARPALEREFNDQVKAVAAGNLEGIRTAFTEAYGAVRQYDSHKNLLSVGTRSQYTVTYRIVHTSPRHVAVLFSVFRYEMGAAHPQSNSLTLNFDLSALTAISLSDLFTPDSAWLKTLSAFCRSDLADSIEDGDEGWIREGTAPEEGNFKNFLILQEGLLVLFDAYQVACYAAGAQEVRVPYTVFKGALRADFKP